MRRVDQEDGAIAVLVAILMTVLIGFAALVVDVGAMHAETRQLQNVADASALAIAQDCGNGLACNAVVGTATAATYAVANSKDLLSTPTVSFPTANSVRVVASTLEASGGGDGNPSTLGWAFAQIFNQPESTFQRQATATWGRFGGGATIPIALCERSWNHFTANGTLLPSGPPAQLIRFGAPNGNAAPVAYEDCTNPSGDTYPGGFGFLRRNADCTALTNENGTFPGTAGSNPVDPASACTVPELYAMLRAIVDAGRPVLIPIFDFYSGNGSTGSFHIIGYGAFVLQGYEFNAGPDPQSRSYGMLPGDNCPNNRECLKGYYTEFVSLEGAASYSPGPGFGGYVVGLTG